MASFFTIFCNSRVENDILADFPLGFLVLCVLAARGLQLESASDQGGKWWEKMARERSWLRLFKKPRSRPTSGLGHGKESLFGVLVFSWG